MPTYGLYLSTLVHEFSGIYVRKLSTIIIALSIEALIVVFKIAINDYVQMINAFYLIAGIALILISLTVFIYFSTKRTR